MTFEATLRSTVASVLADQVFPDVAPVGQALPYATWQMVGGDTAEFLEGGAAVGRNARVQFNVWASTRQQANDLMRQLEDVMRVSLLASPQGALLARFDSTVGVYGAQQDFSVWY